MDKKLQNTDGNYLFNVDILINARTNPLALQYLLEMLNSNDKQLISTLIQVLNWVEPLILFYALPNWP